MYLIDTNVLSEIRKKNNANSGVRDFFARAVEQELSLFISVITVGELRRGVNLIRYRGDKRQANILEKWLELILEEYSDNVLEFTVIEAQVWGAIKSPKSRKCTG